MVAIPYPNPKVERRIRNLKFRLTPQRELILRAVAGRGQHATFEEIYKDVRKQAPQISAATVYRNLETFSRYRLIHANEVAGGKIYELANENGHHHLVCHKCWGDVTLEDEKVRKLFTDLEKQLGFLVLGEHYIFMGLCSGCREAEGDTLGRFSEYPKFRTKSPKRRKEK
jgi:Fe2+ or Zn2+ uptake regulation protein